MMFRGEILLVAVATLAALAHGADTVDKDQPSAAKLSALPRTFDYGEFVQKYKKAYNGTETVAKAKYFFSRTLGIFKHNLQYVTGKVRHYLRQNEYTDMTPNEMRSIFVLQDNGMRPVVEASRMPDLPADQVTDVVILEQQSGLEQESKSSLVGPTADTVERRESNLDFFNHQADVGSLVEELRGLRSRRIQAENLINLEVSNEEAENLAELARKRNGIRYDPNVEPMNENFDPNLIPSYGYQETLNDFSENFAKIMMDDFSHSLQPYPGPEISDTPNRPKKSPLTSLMDSIKTIYEYFNDEEEVTRTHPGDTDEIDREAADDGQVEGTNKGTSRVELPEAANIIKSDQIVYDIDWRQTGCIPRAKSQAECNSCYAFAVLDLMEFFYCRQMKTSVEFSVQYLIDCGGKTQMNGCQGGKLSSVGQFIKRYGIQTSALYPYQARQNQCPINEEAGEFAKFYSFKPTIKGWRMFPEITAWYKWLPRSPVIVGVNMPSDFMAYAGGIHDGSDCTPGMVHAMLLVGSGQQNGQHFWLLKNTFSQSWGEDGYFRLSKGAPLRCFNSAVVARVDFTVSTTTTG